MKNTPAWLADLVNDLDFIPSSVEFEVKRATAPTDENFDRENIPGNFRKIQVIVTGQIIYAGETE